jgi:hypothetical protein
MSWLRQCVGKQDGRSSLHRIYGSTCLRGGRRVWRTVGLRTQTAMALAHRSTRMDICDLFSHSRKDDLGSQTCSQLCIFDGLRRSRDESHLSGAISGWFVLRDSATNRLSKPVRGTWRGFGSSGFSGLTRLFGSTNERDKTDPRTKGGCYGINTHKLADLLLASRLNRFVSPLNRFRYSPSAPKVLPHSQFHALANLNERCPLGMRVADPLVHHRMFSVMQEFAMELTVPMLSEQDRHVQQRNLLIRNAPHPFMEPRRMTPTCPRGNQGGFDDIL